MNLTSKSRYAIKILMDLAMHAEEPQVQRHDIATRQGIPTNYLDQIMLRLRKSKLVESVRGRSGGYRLSKATGNISVWDIFSSVEESILPVKCIQGAVGCDFEENCTSKEAWEDIYEAFKKPLTELTLEQIMRKSVRTNLGATNQGLCECKPGKLPNALEIQEIQIKTSEISGLKQGNNEDKYV